MFKKASLIFIFLTFAAQMVLGQLTSGVQINVMSFNIQHGEVENNESNLLEVLKIIKEQKPDLVAFQAIDSVVLDGKLQFQIRRLALQTGMYYAYTATEEFVFGTQGVAILSRWKIEKNQVIKLPSSTESKDKQSILCGLIKASDNFSFRFCTCQLNQKSPIDKGLQAAYVNQILGRSIQPVILGMDMGARPSEQPFDSFKTKWLDAGRGSQVKTWRDGKNGDRLDYIFILQNNRFRVNNYKVITRYPKVSNRFPVMASIEFW